MSLLWAERYRDIIVKGRVTHLAVLQMAAEAAELLHQLH